MITTVVNEPVSAATHTSKTQCVLSSQEHVDEQVCGSLLDW